MLKNNLKRFRRFEIERERLIIYFVQATIPKYDRAVD